MMKRSKRGSRGAALILVLWLVASLSLVVMASSRGIRLQTQRAALDLERLRAESVLDAAIQLTAQRMMSERTADGRYRIQRLPMGSNDIWVEVTPSGGLVDVNVASEALLQALFQRAGGLSSGEAAILTSRVRDFIDPDDTPGGVGGAEAAQYRAAGWPSLPRNGALDDLSELRSVLGMTSELYEIIAPHLGINGQQRIEIDSAPPRSDRRPHGTARFGGAHSQLPIGNAGWHAFDRSCSRIFLACPRWGWSDSAPQCFCAG